MKSLSRYSKRTAMRCFHSLLPALVLAALAAQAAHAQGYTISTVAGGGTLTYSGIVPEIGDGGPSTQAYLGGPHAVAVDSAGNLYIGDTGAVREVANGVINTVFGLFQIGITGPAVATDSAGDLFISNVLTLGGLTELSPSGKATQVVASVRCNTAIAIDHAGNVYCASGSGVEKISASGSTGFVYIGGLSSLVGGLALDASGTLYVSDSILQQVYKLDASGKATVVAGNGAGGSIGSYSGDGGPATQAGLAAPAGIAFDQAGNLYIADSLNNRIRRVDTSGTITTVAGTGSAFLSGDGGPAASAGIPSPSGIAIGSNGGIYVSQPLDGVVRLLAPANQAAGSAPSVNSGGVVSASAFGEFTSVAPGSWIEIYGSNLAPDTRTWTGGDFNGVDAPESLDGTSVTIGGQPAYVAFISPGQVNVQVPSNVGTGSQPLIVTTKAGGAGNSYPVMVNAEQPGLLAPYNFKIGGDQYVVALFPDNSTYVLPAGAIPGIASRPAQPGDTIILYGVGFGAVTPSIPAGQRAGQLNTLALPLHIFFGSAEATLAYDGLAPGYVGLYQFNVVVPDVGAGNLVPLTFTLGGTQGSQTLYIAVQ
jgi:uncharacterized protein (TIGR03437 family)